MPSSPRAVDRREVSPGGGPRWRPAPLARGTCAGPATMRVPIDVITVNADGRDAHCRRPRDRSATRPAGLVATAAIVAVMNVDHLGAWDVAPRAHPNDGWLDVIEVDASMSLRCALAGMAATAHRQPRAAPGHHHAPRPQRNVHVRQPAAACGSTGSNAATVRSLRVDVEPDRRRDLRVAAIWVGSPVGRPVYRLASLATCCTTSNPSRSAPVDTGLLSADSAWRVPARRPDSTPSSGTLPRSPSGCRRSSGSRRPSAGAAGTPRTRASARPGRREPRIAARARHRGPRGRRWR